MGHVQASLASHLFSVDQRRAERSAFALRTTARVPGQKAIFLRLGNASVGGAMAKSELPIADGTRLQIDMPGQGWTWATVIWSMGDQLGLAFEQLLDQSYIDQLSRMHMNH